MPHVDEAPARLGAARGDVTPPAGRGTADSRHRKLASDRLGGLRGISPRGRTCNVLTIDLEDWPVAVLGPHHEITSRVVENTKRVLQLLRWHDVRATFFVLSRVAERFPDLVRMVHDDGHEIASHGHSHQLITNMTPDEFADDVARSVDILSRVVGGRPVGYRAPAFSVVRNTRWAGAVLEKLGFLYDSSVFPIRHRRYGIHDAPREIHTWDSGGLIECPPATLRLMGRNLPVAGGGYFRLLPGAVARSCIRRLNQRGMPAILYIHPYEMDTDGLEAHRREGLRFGPWRHLTQGLFRARIERRLHRLLESFEFATMRDVLGV